MRGATKICTPLSDTRRAPAAGRLYFKNAYLYQHFFFLFCVYLYIPLKQYSPAKSAHTRRPLCPRSLPEKCTHKPDTRTSRQAFQNVHTLGRHRHAAGLHPAAAFGFRKMHTQAGLRFRPAAFAGIRKNTHLYPPPRRRPHILAPLPFRAAIPERMALDSFLTIFCCILFYSFPLPACCRAVLFPHSLCISLYFSTLAGCFMFTLGIHF